MSSPRGVTDAEVATFNRDGFGVPSYQLSLETVAAMRAATADLIETYPRIPTEGLVSPHIHYAGTNRPDIHEQFLDFCSNPKLLDIAEKIIGPAIIVWGSRIF